MRLALALIGIVLLAMPAVADIPMTVDDAVRRALETSPAIAAARFRSEEAGHAIEEVKAPGRVRADFTSGYSYLNPTVSFPGPAGPLAITTDNNWRAGVAVDYALSTFGRLKWSILAARLAQRAAEQEERLRTQEVRLEARVAYAGALLAEEGLRIAAARVASQSEHVRLAEIRFKAGASARFEVVSLRASLAQARQHLVAAQGRVSDARSALRVMLGLASTDTMLLAPLAPPLEPRPDVAAGEARAQEQRPEVAAVAWAVEAARARLELEKRQGGPTLGFHTHYLRRTETAFFTADEFTAGLQLSVPLLDGGARQARLGQATAVVRRLEQDVAAARRAITLEVEQSATALRTAWHAIGAARETVAQAVEALRIARVRYEAGISTYVELQDALLGLTLAQQSLAEAESASHVAGWRWERAVADP